MIPTSSVFFFIFGSWRSYNSLQHAGIIFEKKKSKKNFSAKTILKKLLTLDSKKTLVASSSLLAASSSSSTPIVINTWSFNLPCEYAWQVLNTTNDCVEAVVNGCSKCEELQCDGTVGYGGSPDETGETTLDAMIMDGKTHDAGCVAGLKRIKSAIKVAFSVMQYTSHTLLVGEAATQYAIQMGFKEESLKTLDSFKKWNDWINNECQPNFRRNVTPDPTKNCGPYKPISNAIYSDRKLNSNVSNKSHDTIGMIAIDSNGNICAGTSTNGAQHKIHGLVIIF
jgi:N4-(beta-N-acetylglucosaminyl)-L-asparaginase